MYRVVKFIDEDMTALVPGNWVTSESKCLLPNFRNYARITTAADTLETKPETTWKEYECSELYRSDNYEKARKWLTLSEQLSKLETASSSSSSEDGGESKRKKRKRQVDFDSSSGEDETIETPTLQIIDVKPPSPADAPCSPSPITEYRPPSPLEASSPSNQALAKTESRMCCCGSGVSATQFDDAMMRIFGLLETLNESIQVLKRQTALGENATLPEGVTLPVNSLQSLTNLETILSKEDNFKSMVNNLCLIGGDSIKSVVSYSLKHIFTTSFATTMCWSGSASKLKFHTLRLKDVIVDVVRRSHKQATAEEIKSAIRRWFHCAADRDGGRRRRSKC